MLSKNNLLNLFILFSFLMSISLVNALIDVNIEKIYENDSIKLYIENSKAEDITLKISDLNTGVDKGFFIECLELNIPKNSSGFFEYNQLYNYNVDVGLDSKDLYLSPLVYYIDEDDLSYSNDIEIGNMSNIDFEDFSKVQVHNLCREEQNEQDQQQDEEQQDQQQNKQEQEEQEKTLEELQKEQDEYNQNMEEMQETYDQLSDIQKKQNYAQTTQQDQSLNSIKQSLENQKKQESISDYNDKLEDQKDQEALDEMMKDQEFSDKVQDYLDQGYKLSNKEINNDSAKLEFQKDNEHQEVFYNQSSNEMIDTKDFQENYPQEDFDKIDNRIDQNSNSIQSQMSNENINMSINTSLDNNISNISFSNIDLEKKILKNNENKLNNKLIEANNKLKEDYDDSPMSFYKDNIALSDLSNLEDEQLDFKKEYISNGNSTKTKQKTITGTNKGIDVLDFKISNSYLLIFLIVLSILVLFIGILFYNKKQKKKQKNKLKIVEKIKYFYYLNHARNMYKLSLKKKGKEKIVLLSKAFKSYLISQKIKRSQKPKFFTNKEIIKFTENKEIKLIFNKLDLFLYSNKINSEKEENNLVTKITDHLKNIL